MKTGSDILLVGSDGYIGSNCPFECDTMDIKSGRDFTEKRPKKYKTLIFLAARLKNTNPDFIYNEFLYIQLDKWLNRFPDTHVIYASSAAVYGEGIRPHKENELLVPVNLYGKSKLSGEFRVREYENHTVLRFGNVYDRMHGQDGHGVTELFKAGHKVIFGDGNQVRDFVPISMIWRVIECAVKYPKYWQGVFNISTSDPVTINDWYKRYGRGEPVYEPVREGDIYMSMLDNTKMKDRLALCQ